MDRVRDNKMAICKVISNSVVHNDRYYKTGETITAMTMSEAENCNGVLITGERIREDVDFTPEEILKMQKFYVENKDKIIPLEEKAPVEAPALPEEEAPSSKRGKPKGSKMREKAELTDVDIDEVTSYLEVADSAET